MIMSALQIHKTVNETTIMQSPDDGDKLSHSELLGYQELGLVQDWQVLLVFVALHDDWSLVGVFHADVIYFSLPARCGVVEVLAFN